MTAIARFSPIRLWRDRGSGFLSLRWILFSVLIGAVAGLAAVIFFAVIEGLTQLILAGVVSYAVPGTAAEGGAPVMSNMDRPWLLPVVTTLGGLLGGIIVYRLAPETEGAGQDAAIDAFHTGTPVRARVPLVKMIASAITIGSGGSAGREGPMAHITAGLGSLIGRRLHLSDRERRLAIAIGAGAGIGAIFKAPLGGGLMAAEILYTDDLEVEAILPSMVASIVSYTIFASVYGFAPIFGEQTNLLFDSPLELIYFAALGLACGLIGILFIKSFRETRKLFERFRIPRWTKPALGGLLVGLIGLALPEVIHSGYGWAQIGIDNGLATLPLWILLLLPFAKILATSLTVGSGASGGVFGPGVVIGALTGTALWRLATDFGDLPFVPNSPGSLAIVGMMALFGAVAHAPLAVMLMVAEMTGNLALLAPAMIAVAIASGIVGKRTIFESQVSARPDSGAHQGRFSVPLLKVLRVSSAMVRAPRTLKPDATVADAQAALVAAKARSLPILDEDQRLVGVVDEREILAVREAERGRMSVAEIADPEPPTVSPDDPLESVLRLLAKHQTPWMPVRSGPEGRMLGIISGSDVVRTYAQTAATERSKATLLANGTVLLEVNIDSRSPLAGTALRDADMPGSALVVAIKRGRQSVIPSGDTVIGAGDLVTLISDVEEGEALRSYVEGRDGS